MLRHVAIFGAIAVFLTLAVIAVSLGRAQARRQDACTHGESSTRIYYQDGVLHQTAPAVTGCLP